MRKVFLTTIPIKENNCSRCVSDDIELSNCAYRYPITYIVDTTVEEGDSILVATLVTENSNEGNYIAFCREIQSLLFLKKVKCDFLKVVIPNEFTTLSCQKLLTNFASIFKSDDKIYLDTTYANKAYTLNLFVALAYATKVNDNTDVEQIICAEDYKVTSDEYIMKIHDLTGFFFLNEIIVKSKTGDKEGIDSILNFIISK